MRPNKHKWQVGFYRLWLVLMLVAAGLLRPQPAAACSCWQSATPEEKFDALAAVFVGEVESMHTPALSQMPLSVVAAYQKLFGPVPPNTFTYEVTMTVSEAWKGVNTTRVKVIHNQETNVCGYMFREGGKYLVYATDEGDYLRTRICFGTLLPVDKAMQDLAFLAQRPTVPLAAAHESSFAASSVVAGLVLGGLLWYRHRQKKS